MRIWFVLLVGLGLPACDSDDNEGWPNPRLGEEYVTELTVRSLSHNGPSGALATAPVQARWAIVFSGALGQSADGPHNSTHVVDGGPAFEAQAWEDAFGLLDWSPGTFAVSPGLRLGEAWVDHAQPFATGDVVVYLDLDGSGDLGISPTGGPYLGGLVDEPIVAISASRYLAVSDEVLIWPGEEEMNAELPPGINQISRSGRCVGDSRPVAVETDDLFELVVVEHDALVCLPSLGWGVDAGPGPPYVVD